MKYLKLLALTVLTMFAVSVLAQKQEVKESANKMVSKDTVYQCPMKCEGDKTYNAPGKCPVCHMNLRAIPGSAPVAALYQCPMKCEGDKKYDKPGKCPVCGMNLREIKIEANSEAKPEPKKEIMAYACRKHPEIQSAKPGRCTICNKKLKKIEEDHSGHNP